jgi:hypothetical protein
MHSDKLEVFSIAQNPASQSQILSARGDVLTGGITPQCIAVSPDGRTVYVANMQTEDVSILGVRSDPADAERDPAAAEPAGAVPTASEATQISRGAQLFANEVTAGSAGGASCHHNGDQVIDGARNDTFQDYNVHEPGVPRWLHHGFAHSVREILLAPDSPLLQPGERGFNFRTVRTDAVRRVAADFLAGPTVALPTEVPIAIADTDGHLGGDGKGPILVSLDAPSQVAAPDAGYPDGRLLVDQLGTSNLAPVVVMTGGQRQVNPALIANHIQLIKDTHGKTSQLSQADLDALIAYVTSLQ